MVPKFLFPTSPHSMISEYCLNFTLYIYKFKVKLGYRFVLNRSGTSEMLRVSMWCLMHVHSWSVHRVNVVSGFVWLRDDYMYIIYQKALLYMLAYGYIWEYLLVLNVFFFFKKTKLYTKNIYFLFMVLTLKCFQCIRGVVKVVFTVVPYLACFSEAYIKCFDHLTSLVWLGYFGKSYIMMILLLPA